MWGNLAEWARYKLFMEIPHLAELVMMLQGIEFSIAAVQDIKVSCFVCRFGERRAQTFRRGSGYHQLLCRGASLPAQRAHRQSPCRVRLADSPVCSTPAGGASTAPLEVWTTL